MILGETISPRLLDAIMARRASFAAKRTAIAGAVLGAAAALRRRAA